MNIFKDSLEAKENFPVKNELNLYLQQFPQERQRMHDFWQSFPTGTLESNIFDRKQFPWHITASGIVFLDGKLLLVRHPHINAWIPPGGHVEMQESPGMAAIREVREEVGMLSELHEWHHACLHPLDIDIHLVSSNASKGEPAHWHCDFRYLLKLLAGPYGSNELAYDWKKMDDVSFGGVDRIRRKLSEI